jgi:hypothetical protein
MSKEQPCRALTPAWSRGSRTCRWPHDGNYVAALCGLALQFPFRATGQSGNADRRVDAFRCRRMRAAAGEIDGSWGSVIARIPRPEAPSPSPSRDTCDACAIYRRIRVDVDIWRKCHKCHGLAVSPSIPRPSCLRWQRNPRLSSACTKRFRVPGCSLAVSAHSFQDENRVLVSSQLSSLCSQRSSIQAPTASSLSK